MHKTACWMLAIALASAMVGCNSGGDTTASSPNLEGGANSPTDAQPNATSPQATSSATTAARPQTKPDTISVEGEQRQVTLALFQDPTMPFVTYFPQNAFEPEVKASSEGKATWFYWKNQDGSRNDDVYLEVYIPTGNLTAEQVGESLTTEQSLFTSDRWELVNRTQEVPYPWAIEKYTFRTTEDNQVITAIVYVGQHNGETFRVIERFPGDYGDAFGPLAGKVLGNLEFTQPLVGLR